MTDTHDTAEVLALARQRWSLLAGWSHPERYVPLVLPEGLPAPIPPWWRTEEDQ